MGETVIPDEERVGANDKDKMVASETTVMNKTKNYSYSDVVSGKRLRHVESGNLEKHNEYGPLVIAMSTE